MTEIELRNDDLQLAFDQDRGTLTRLALPGLGWVPLDQAGAGLSFQLLLPLPDRRNNPVRGEEQDQPEVELADDGSELTMTWPRVRSLHGGRHDVLVRERVRLCGPRAIFELELENHSELTVESVHFPYLADVRPPQDATRFVAFSLNYSTAQEWPLWPTYRNQCGYWGVDSPSQYGGATNCGAPMTPFILLRSTEQGLYVGVDSLSSELVAWHTELWPGHSEAMDSRVPDGWRVGDLPVTTRFAAVHLPYLEPGGHRALTPIAIEGYRGDWHRGADVYTSWRNERMATPPRPSWVDQPHTWQQLQINSPEDELRFSFSEFVEVGRRARDNGVKAIQLVGWHEGGQDRGGPSHRPDPRLGTVPELRDAIEEVRQMGVKTVLFSKFTWADRSTERFRQELIDLAVRDPYGDYYMAGGYRYQTPAQLLDVSTRRLVPMCFLAEDYLRVCEEEFRKLLEVRPDGILFDECQHHGPPLLCFDTSHGHRAGAPLYANDRLLIQRLGRIAEEAGIEFIFAGEACYDWELDAYQVVYLRSAGREYLPLQRYLRPDQPIMTALTGFDDRNMVNQCLLYRYIISYEPYYFKGQVTDYPLTLAYARQMEELRTRLREHLWDATFRHTLGARVEGEKGDHHPYSVFVAADGISCVAIANYDDEPATVVPTLDGGRPLARWCLVDDPEWRQLKDGVTIPGRSAAVVLER